MATLTTSWASYASASQTISGVTVTFYLEAKYSSQSTQNNTSVIQTRLRSTINAGGSLRGAGYYFSCSYCNTRQGTEIWTFANEVILSSGDKTITHNTDGSKSISLAATAKNTYWNINKNMSVTVNLPKINRLATINTATDFTDEGNPTITFDNPAGFTVKPYINFYDNNNSMLYRLQRDISATTPYNWEITNAERTAIRSALVSQPTYRAQMGVDTYSGSTVIGYNSVARTLTFVNANPTQSITVSETNQKIINLLGSSSANTIVQNASNLTFTVTPTALKSATISKVELTHNGNTVSDTTSPYEFTNIIPTTNTFNVKTTDSRTFSIEDTITKTIINYEPIDIVSVEFKRYAPTSSDVVLNAEIKYVQTTFGNTANAPTIKWKLGEEGTLHTLSSSDYTIDTTNNKITISNLTLSNILAYTSEARAYFYVEDLLTTDEDSHSVVLRGIPTVDAGEHDFQVNGDLYIADINRANRKHILDLIHPIGSLYISVDSTSPATLFGGTWQQITSDAYLKIVTSNGGDLGGTASDHKIPISSMPSHKHNAGGYNPAIAKYQYTTSGDGFQIVTSGSAGRYNIASMDNTGGGNAYYPYYLGVYVWKRTA